MISFLINLPYTIIGIFIALLLIPERFEWKTSPLAVVVYVRGRSLDLGYMKRWRGMTVGHVVILNPDIEEGDLEHELVHVEQYGRLPLVYPAVYVVELMRKGYRANKYEEEAYTRAGNSYKGK